MIDTSIPQRDDLPATLFDGFEDDTPRARSTDPLTSHSAADRSMSNRMKIRGRVVTLFQEWGPMTDAELTKLYFIKFPNHPSDACHVDSPRKRRSELKSDGYLEKAGARRDHQDVYRLAVN